MLHKQNEIIAERYQIIAILNKKKRGTDTAIATYMAFDLRKSRSVMLTVFSSKEATDWKTVKLLFECEANILLSLNHPSIPRYIDYFEIDNIDTDNICHFYLVRESVTGKSLAELVVEGWRPSETKVKELAVQLLDTLNYLHSRAIIHQNIKPENVILGENDRVYLVNFGSIEKLFLNHYPSRRVATFCDDFADLERLSSIEYVTSKPAFSGDLYGVGFCLIFLLSGKSSVEFWRSPTSDIIDLITHIDVSPDFRQWLKKLVEQKPRACFDSAAAAIGAMPTRLKAESKQPVSDLVAKHELTIAHQPDCLRYKFFASLGDRTLDSTCGSSLCFNAGSPRTDKPHNDNGLSRNARKKAKSTIAKLFTAIVGLLTLPEFTVVGIGIWLFCLCCIYLIARPITWTW